jgi:hypothetical protein
MKISINSPEELLEFLQDRHSNSMLTTNELDKILSQFLKVFINKELSLEVNLKRFAELVASGKIDDESELQIFL